MKQLLTISLISLFFPACECEAMRTQKRLVGNGNFSCRNLVKITRDGKNTSFDKKHILLFSRNGYFNDLFFRNGKQFTNKTTHSPSTDDTPILTCGYVAYKAHRWSLTDGKRLRLNQDTVSIHKLTRDSLIIEQFAGCTGCERMIYVRKTDLSDVDPDILSRMP